METHGQDYIVTIHVGIHSGWSTRVGTFAATIGSELDSICRNAGRSVCVLCIEKHTKADTDLY